MTNRKYLRTQRRNPHKLPVKQHVFPVASIARFCDNDDRVELYNLQITKRRKAGTKDDIFCALRAWDAKSETGYMKQIEDNFQCLARNIILHPDNILTADEKLVVDQFYALWKVRASYKNETSGYIKISNIVGDRLTQDQEEILEKNGYIFAKEGGLTPAHMMNGLQIQFKIRNLCSQLSDVRWVVTSASEGQFIVPDVIALTYVPLTPNLCLSGTLENIQKRVFLPKSGITKLNKLLQKGSEAYYFSNNLSKCF